MSLCNPPPSRSLLSYHHLDASGSFSWLPSSSITQCSARNSLCDSCWSKSFPPYSHSSIYSPWKLRMKSWIFLPLVYRNCVRFSLISWIIGWIWWFNHACENHDRARCARCAISLGFLNRWSFCAVSVGTDRGIKYRSWLKTITQVSRKHQQCLRKEEISCCCHFHIIELKVQPVT